MKKYTIIHSAVDEDTLNPIVLIQDEYSKSLLKNCYYALVINNITSGYLHPRLADKYGLFIEIQTDSECLNNKDFKGLPWQLGKYCDNITDFCNRQ